MLPAATVPAARGSATPPDHAAGGGASVPLRERRKGPVRDAAAGLAEVMAMPAIWGDAGSRLAELPGPGSGIVACGALPGVVSPAPAWTAGELAAAGSRRPRAGAGGDRAGAGIGGAYPGAAGSGAGRGAGRAGAEDHAAAGGAGVPGPGAGARSCPGGAAGAGAAAPGADPGYDLPAASSLSDAGSFLLVRPFPRLLAGLFGEVRAAPLPGVARTCPRPGRPPGNGRRPGCGPWNGRAGRGGTAAGTAEGAGQGRHRPPGRRP